MTLIEKLQQFVNSAPRGTMIPVEGLAQLISDAQEEVADLAVEDIARLAAVRFGRTEPYTPGAIRKWIRSGLNGVQLPAYPYGRGVRVRARDFDEFVSKVRGQKPGRPERETHVPAGPEIDTFSEFEADVHSAASQSYAASR